MLTYLVIHNCFVSDVYIEDISSTECQLHHIHLEEYFIELNHIQMFRIYARMIMSLFHLININWVRGISQHSMLGNN